MMFFDKYNENPECVSTCAITLAKMIAADKTNQELALVTSFLSLLSSNISAIVQSRNYVAANLSVIEDAETADENANNT